MKMASPRGLPTVPRVEEIEDESDGEAAAAVDSEDERAEQAVLMERHRANFKVTAVIWWV